MYNSIITVDLLPSACIDGKQMLPACLRQAGIIDEIMLEVYNGWVGKTGEERVLSVLKIISERVPQYAKVAGKTELEFLTLYAKSRRCNYTNWFQSSYLPDLSDVIVFDTVEDFKNKFPSGKYTCPRCGGETTDYQQCNSGKVIDKKGKVCDWKVYGLFGDMGKGIRVIIKNRIEDFPKPISMFKPIELCEVV